MRTVSGPVTKIDFTGTSKGPATGDSCYLEVHLQRRRAER
jgi:hypothetical protein